MQAGSRICRKKTEGSGGCFPGGAWSEVEVAVLLLLPQRPRQDSTWLTAAEVLLPVAAEGAASPAGGIGSGRREQGEAAAARGKPEEEAATLRPTEAARRRRRRRRRPSTRGSTAPSLPRSDAAALPRTRPPAAGAPPPPWRPRRPRTTTAVLVAPAEGWEPTAGQKPRTSEKNNRNRPISSRYVADRFYLIRTERCMRVKQKLGRKGRK